MRHQEVKEDDVRYLIFQCVEGLLTAVGPLDLVALILKELRDQIYGVRLIVHYQHPVGRGTGGSLECREDSGFIKGFHQIIECAETEPKLPVVYYRQDDNWYMAGGGIRL